MEIFKINNDERKSVNSILVHTRKIYLKFYIFLKIIQCLKYDFRKKNLRSIDFRVSLRFLVLHQALGKVQSKPLPLGYIMKAYFVL